MYNGSGSNGYGRAAKYGIRSAVCVLGDAALFFGPLGGKINNGYEALAFAVPLFFAGGYGKEALSPLWGNFKSRRLERGKMKETAHLSTQ
jgi:hypothetical protein